MQIQQVPSLECYEIHGFCVLSSETYAFQSLFCARIDMTAKYKVYDMIRYDKVGYRIIVCETSLGDYMAIVPVR